MSSVFQLMNQQFPGMFKSPPGEANGSLGARLSGAGGQKVVCTPEVSLYQYTSPEMAAAAAAAAANSNPLTRIPEEKVGLVEPNTGNIPGVISGQLANGGGFQCGVCGKTFQQKNTFQNHLRSHREGDDPYQCDICGKTFAVPARLTRHYRTHTGEKPYQCEYCNKSFSVKENLSVHRRIHTKERPYKCEVCERAFEHSGKLHRHMRIHTGERPHRCQICQKTFIQSGQLVIHMRTHTGEKPYVCKVCGKGFTCSKQLKVHTRTHTGEKPYTCDICGKSFGYNHVLKLHQVAHYGEKVYKCTLCNGTFNSKKALETHIKTHSDDHVPIGPGSPQNVTEPRVMSPASISQQATPQSQNSDKENRECSDSELSSQNSPSSSSDGPKTPPSPPIMYSSSSSTSASANGIGDSRYSHLTTPYPTSATSSGGFNNRMPGNNSSNANQSPFTDSSSSSTSNNNSNNNNRSSNNSSNNNSSNSTSTQDKTYSSLPIPCPMLPPGVQIQQAPHSRTTYVYVTSKLPPHPALNHNANNNSSSSCLSDSPPPVSPPLNGVRQSLLSPPHGNNGFIGLANNNSSNANKVYAKGGNSKNVNIEQLTAANNNNGRDKMLMYSSTAVAEKVLAFTKQFGYGLGPGEQHHLAQQNAQNTKRFVETRHSNRDSSSGGISVHPVMVPENLSFNNSSGSNGSKAYPDEHGSSSSMYHQNRLRHHHQQHRDRSSSPEIINHDQMSNSRHSGYTPSGVLELALTKGSKAVAAAAAAAASIPAKISVIPVSMSNNGPGSNGIFNGYHNHHQISRLSPRSNSPSSPIDFHSLQLQQHHHQKQQNNNNNSIFASSGISRGPGSVSPVSRASLHSPSPNTTPRSTPSLQEDYSDPEMMMTSNNNSKCNGELSSDENSSNSSSSGGTKRARSPNSNSSGGAHPRKRSSLILEKYAMETHPASPSTPPNSESILSQRLRLSSVIQYAEKCS